ncbi:hypothetical protein D3C81_1618180 [compost metagenome]
MGGDDQVGQDFTLARRHQAVVDLDRSDLSGAFQGDRDKAAARGALGGGFGHLGLGVLQLLLHGLGLLHQGVEVFHSP